MFFTSWDQWPKMILLPVRDIIAQMAYKFKVQKMKIFDLVIFDINPH